MTRHLFPGDLAEDSTGPVPNARVHYYSDAARTTEVTDLTSDQAGTHPVTANLTGPLNGNPKGYFSEVYGPDGVQTLYVGVEPRNGGPPTIAVLVYAIDADIAGAAAAAQATAEAYADARDAAHVAATDPHGDRAYSSGLVSSEATTARAAEAANATAIASKAPIATTTIDLVDRTNNTTETVPAGFTTNCSTAGVTKTAPALAGSVGTPPLRWAVRNGSTGTITLSYPDTAGVVQSLTMLAGEVLTFRQKNTSGWAAESGNKTLASLSGAFMPLVGVSNGTDDTATINGLLTAANTAGRGYVRGTPGQTYLISACLMVPSHTTLDMTGCAVKLKSSSAETNMVRNANYANCKRVMDGAMTAGSTLLACATSTPFSGGLATVGTPVLVWGAGRFGGNLSTTIAAVTDSGHVTLADPSVVAVTGATVCVGKRDTNVRVIGGTWDRNGVTTTGGPDVGDNLKFRSVDRVCVQGVFFPSNGFHDVNFADCTQVEVDDVMGNQSTQTDLVHLNGPLDAVHISNVHGICASCMVAICPNDYTGATGNSGGEDVWGWITNVEIDGVHAEPNGTALPVAVEGGSASPLTGTKHVRIRNVSGFSGGGEGAVLIGDDAASPITTGGRIEDIEVDVEGLVWNSAFSSFGIMVNPSNGKNITILNAGLNLDGGGGHGAALVGCPASTNLESLVIKQVRLGTFSDAGPSILQVGGVVTNVTIEDVTGGNGSYAIQLTGSGSITRAKVTDVAMNGRLCPAQAPAGTTLSTLQLANYEASGSGYVLGDFGGTTKVFVSNLKASASATSLINLAATAAVTLWAGSCDLGGFQPTGSAGGSLRCRSLGCQVDLANSFIAKNVGDMAYNTNSGTSGGVGPCVCTGTAWTNLVVGTSVITGVPVPRSGRYLTSAPTGGTISNGTFSSGQLRYSRLVIGAAGTITEIGINVSTGTASSTPRLGVYADNSGQPGGAPLLDAGTVDGSTTGYKSITGLSLAVSAGTYWVAVAANGAAVVTSGVTGIDPVIQEYIGSTGLDSTGYLDAASVPGALPTANPNGAVRGPLVSVKFA